MIKSMMMEMWFSRSSQKSSQSHPKVVPESLQSPITKNTNPITDPITDSLSFCDWSIPCRVASLLFAVYSCKENLLMSHDRITYPSAQVNAFELKRDSYLWLISDLMRGSTIREHCTPKCLHLLYKLMRSASCVVKMLGCALKCVRTCQHSQQGSVRYRV